MLFEIEVEKPLLEEPRLVLHLVWNAVDQRLGGPERSEQTQSAEFPAQGVDVARMSAERWVELCERVLVVLCSEKPPALLAPVTGGRGGSSWLVPPQNRAFCHHDSLSPVSPV